MPEIDKIIVSEADEINLFANKAFLYAFFSLILCLLFFLFFNLFYMVPERQKFTSVDMELPLIHAQESELKAYREKIRDFEEKDMLESYNREGIYTKEQLQKDMVKPAR